MTKTMWGNLFKFGPIFLLLVLSGLVFLLRNIQSLEKFSCKTVAALYQLQSRIDSTFKPGDREPLDRNWSYCGSPGAMLTPEEAAEERHLLDSIAWPEPAWSLPVPLRQSSDPARSFFVVLPAPASSGWHVGGRLEARVHMRDFQNRPKRRGGDFLLARLHSPELKAGVAGRVTDHQNGFYTVRFWLPWPGPAQVEVTLVHPSEAVQVLRRLREEHPDRVFFKSLFRSKDFSETTVCNLCLPLNQPRCNYSNRFTGEPWFCYKPKLLTCEHRVNHAKGGYQKNLLTKKEELFFQSGVNIKVRIRASGPDRVTVLPESKETAEAKKTGEAATLVPSGFYYGDAWRSLGKTPVRQFNGTAGVAECLRGKEVYMFGDSTVRQWYEYLSTLIPGLNEFKLRSPKNVGPFMSVDMVHRILLMYRCHGPPIRFSTVSSSQLRYVASELEALEGGPDTVVVVSVWSHFSTFAVEVYLRRLRAIRAAVLNLLERAPETLVVLRTPNPQALDPEVSLYNSDWYSHQLDAVLRAMFSGLDVVLVDAWEMTLAHRLPHALHPPPAIIKNAINVFLTHVCPLRNV